MGYGSAMSRERHRGVTRATDPLVDLRSTWPPRVPPENRGYRATDLRATYPLGACDLGEGRVVVVVGRPSGPATALPCIRIADGWRVATAGDGVAVALLARLESPGWVLPSGFELTRFDERGLALAGERELGTDQSNISVVVGDSAIVKWRSAADADGDRATRLRRHLAAGGFGRTPALLASLAWSDGKRGVRVLADVDAFLPDAEDGWDHGISTLSATIEASGAPEDSYAESLAQLTAQLHASLMCPSPIIASPTGEATSAQMSAVRGAGLQLLERALAIAADDRSEFVARAPLLRAAIESVPSDGTALAHIHGDLHLGQLVAWRGGLDVIDFDGAPEPTAPRGDLDAPARDVAQMSWSLWSLAAVVDRRTDGAHRSYLRSWAERAEAAFLAAYRRELVASGTDVFDERLLEPFMAEQLCRELLYADTTLPRWRYAAMQALRWRYPLRHHDDV